MLAPVSMPPAWLDQDVASVRRAAGLLQIQEFAFFRLAYRHWHGRSAPDRDLEPLFISYLFRRRVPPWVRHLAREVQERSANAALLPQDSGLEIASPPPAVVHRRRRQLALVMASCGCCALVALLAV
jgi:hypothetical protein